MRKRAIHGIAQRRTRANGQFMGRRPEEVTAYAYKQLHFTHFNGSCRILHVYTCTRLGIPTSTTMYCMRPAACAAREAGNPACGKRRSNMYIPLYNSVIKTVIRSTSSTM
eukprot:COSAG02_NODE_321_length_24780_cov_11.623962_18_plen_110_part_00